VLEDSTALGLHLQETVVCTPQLSNTWNDSEGFTEDSERRLRKRNRSGKSEAEKWKDIYKILFPRDSEQSIPGPCRLSIAYTQANIRTVYDLEIAAGEAARRFAAENLLQYHQHQNNRTVALLQSEISIMGQSGMAPFSQIQLNWVIQTVLNIQNAIYGGYVSSTDASSPVEPISSQLPVSPEGIVTSISTVSSAGLPESHSLGSLIPLDDGIPLSNYPYGLEFSEPINSDALGLGSFLLESTATGYLPAMTSPTAQNLESEDDSWIEGHMHPS
jgi:hypothetical protein